jgi:broad specificity phosphatase PhoE
VKDSAMTRRIPAFALALAVLVAAFLAPVAWAAPDGDITLTFIRHGQSAGNTSGFIDTSTMVRTQQTAQPLAEELHDTVDVLPGLREIEAGDYEGRPETDGAGFYDVLKQWATGDRNARIPGSIDGNEFNARFTDAVAAIYATGEHHPVAFSHGGAIALWTLMNAHNADPALLQADPLNNTGYVVVHGSPSAGWTLVDWNGVRV